MSRLRIFWKCTLLPVCSVASFCENFRGSRKIYLLLQFSRYRDAVCGFIQTTKFATKCWKQNFEYLPQKNFRAIQSQIFFQIFFDFGGSKKFWGKKFKIPLPTFVANFVVRWLPKTAYRYLKVKGDRFPVKNGELLKTEMRYRPLKFCTCTCTNFASTTVWYFWFLIIMIANH